MIYDIIYTKPGTLEELTVTNYLDFADAKRVAENLVLATNKEVHLSIRLGSYLPKVVWQPTMEDNLENMVKKLSEEKL